MMVVTETPLIGQRRLALSTHLNLETPLVRHNVPGDLYSVVIVPLEFVRGIELGHPFQLGFSLYKERAAKKITRGHHVFVYVKSPLRLVIGLAQATGPAFFAPEVDVKYLWRVPCEWLIGPKSKGVSLKEIVPTLKQRIGDALYGVTEDLAERFIQALREQDDLRPSLDYGRPLEV